MTALLAKGGPLNPVFLEVMTVSIIYGAVLVACRGRAGRFDQRISWVLSYVFVVWFYLAVARITPALGTALRDGPLLAADEALFGRTPAVFLERTATAWLTDLMSLCYMTYHLYLPVAVVHAAAVSNMAARRLMIYLFTGFAIGFAGYLLVPAIGPARAFPELFHASLAGGTLWRCIDQVVTKGSSGYDCFPSLHVLIACILLDHDWRHVRWRFWIMVFPSMGLLISTIYLRYHYGVDVLAGLLFFLVIRAIFLKTGRMEARVAG